MGAANAVRVDGEQLTGLDLPDERRADDVERGGLARDHPAPLETTEHQRAHAVRVLGTQSVCSSANTSENAPRSPRQRTHRGLFDPDVRGGGGQQLADEVRVRTGGRAGWRSRGFAAPRPRRAAPGVHQFPLWPSAGRCPWPWCGTWAGRSPRGGSGGGVAHVPDREVAVQRREHLLVEDLAHQPEVLEHHRAPTVGDGFARRLLPAMLQRVQAVVGELGDLVARGPTPNTPLLRAGSRRGPRCVRWCRPPGTRFGTSPRTRSSGSADGGPVAPPSRCYAAAPAVLATRPGGTAGAGQRSGR